MMSKQKNRLWISLVAILMITVVLAGCGGGSGSNVKRVSGLAADNVVKTFYDAAKNNKMQEAGLYIAPDSQQNASALLKSLTNQKDLAQIKNSNLLSVKVLSQQDKYAVALATMQMQSDSLNIIAKPVGLEKIDGEWYIIDAERVYRDAKYNILRKLMENI